jgi:hypothetical protein
MLSDGEPGVDELDKSAPFFTQNADMDGGFWKEEE